MNTESLRYAPSLIVAGLVLLAAYLLLQALAEVLELIVVVFLGGVLAVILEPVAGYFTRYRIPRAVSIIAVYAAAAGLLALFAWYAIPELADELDRLTERIETLKDDYAEFAEDTGFPSVEQVSDYRERIVDASGPRLASEALGWASLVLSLFTVLVVAVFYSSVQPSMRSLLISLISARHRPTWDSVLTRIGHRLRGYAVGEAISMTLVGIITYVSLTLLGIPFAFILAAIAFITEILPIVGPWIGYVPALAVAATEGWVEVLLVSALYIGIQQLESNVILPVVQQRQSELPALVIFVAILVGGALVGVLGALAALPLSIIIHTVVMDVVVPWRQKQAGGTPPHPAADAGGDS